MLWSSSPTAVSKPWRRGRRAAPAPSAVRTARRWCPGIRRPARGGTAPATSRAPRRRAAAASAAGRSGRRNPPPGKPPAVVHRRASPARRPARRRSAAARAGAVAVEALVLPQADRPLPAPRLARCRCSRRRRAARRARRRCRGSRTAASGPTASPSARSMRTPSEWKVLTASSLAARGPISALARSRISAAALLVKVIAAMCFGAMPDCSSRAILCTMTRVLPEPAPASTRQGPPRWCTACNCAGLREGVGHRGGEQGWA